MRGSVLRAVPGGTRFRLFGFAPELRPGLTYAPFAAGVWWPLLRAPPTGQFQHVRFISLVFAVGAIVCARRNTVQAKLR
jgi:hypothetical protein